METDNSSFEMVEEFKYLGTTVWGREEEYTGFWWGNLREKRPLGSPRCRWEDNIKMNLQEVGCGGMDWIKLAQGRERWWDL